ncbi:MAG: glycosyltransferase family 4 protein [Okeania sp. SIO3H1]|uniref:glycosyltransferase n=1 Tax=Okeania sp. SIO1I7 TaxID=2607772 RepID=UPI0013C55109|nr:glycosyltransferase [Okeania sp. SIO1I7]NEN90423.1 glycosyltransferase family 4 protein [Okeania sp. SIO3H1]NET29671.1 glycosyltransferase family 4 protein [Okeania sp. SIO1I7]
MTTLESLIYISAGNLPSLWANTVQTAKMSQAFSQKLKHFELVTSGDICSAFRGMDKDFQAWYSLERPYNLVRLPMHIQVNYPFSKSYGNYSYFRLAALYACWKFPSLIYTRSPEIVGLMTKFGIPVMWEWHEPIQPNSPLVPLLSSNYLIGFVTLSPYLMDSLLQSKINPNKVFISPSAADISTFLPAQSKTAARQKLGLPQDAKIVVYSGHLYDYKGIPTILEIAQLLPECQFLLVGGWQKDVERVRLSCQQRHLTNIQLTGHVAQSELATYLYASDIFLLPTSQTWALAQTTSPLKLFDYMATNRPIIASALPTIMQTVEDRETALLVKSDEPKAWKEAIAQLLKDRTLSKRLAKKAFQKVQTLTWDRRADQILKFATHQLQGIDSQNFQPRINLIRHTIKLVYGKLTTKFKVNP